MLKVSFLLDERGNAASSGWLTHFCLISPLSNLSQIFVNEQIRLEHLESVLTEPSRRFLEVHCSLFFPPPLPGVAENHVLLAVQYQRKVSVGFFFFFAFSFLPSV